MDEPIGFISAVLSRRRRDRGAEREAAPLRGRDEETGVRHERAQAEGLECHRLPARVGTRDGEAAPLGRHAQIDRHHRPAGFEAQRVAGRGERHVRRAERGPRAAVPGGELGVGVLAEPAGGM